MPTQAREARLDDAGGVLGHVEQDAVRSEHLEAAEARRAARDGQSEVESEPALAALRGAPDDADAGACPEIGDQPRALGVGLVEVGGANDRKGVVEAGHEISPHAVCTCSAVTDLDFARAAAMRA